MTQNSYEPNADAPTDADPHAPQRDFSIGNLVATFFASTCITLPCLAVALSLNIDGNLQPLISRGELYGLVLIEYMYGGAIVLCGLTVGTYFRSRLLMCAITGIPLLALGVGLIVTDAASDLGEGGQWATIFGTSFLVTLITSLSSFHVRWASDRLVGCALLLGVFALAFVFVPT